MVLFLAIERVAPLPIEHRVRTVAHGLPGHGTSFAGIERRVYRSPVDRARLSLHHPEILTLPSAREVMHGAVAGDIQVAFAYVVVPCGEIKRLGDLVVVPVVGPSEAADVGGDVLAQVSEFANSVD